MATSSPAAFVSNEWVIAGMKEKREKFMIFIDFVPASWIISILLKMRQVLQKIKETCEADNTMHIRMLLLFSICFWIPVPSPI